MEKSCSRWMREFDTANLWLSNEPAESFSVSKLGRPSVFYTAYRLLVAASLCGLLLFDLLTERPFWSWFLYLTNWGYTITCLHMVLMASHATWQLLNPELRYPNLLRSMKMDWVLHNVTISATCSTPLMVAAYWVLADRPSATFSSLTYHGAGCLLVLVDLVITSLPVRLLHFWHGQLFAAIYAFYTVISYIAGAPCIYVMLDWSRAPLQAGVMVVLTLVTVPLCHLCVFLVFLLTETVCPARLTEDGELPTDDEEDDSEMKVDNGVIA